jgi:hypothetical protein
MSTSSEDLLAQAQARLQELEQLGDGGDLGDRVELESGEHFAGRFRGEATMHAKDGDSFPVIALWDEDGGLRFHYRNAALVEELLECDPAIGDELVIVRGQDYAFEVNGEPRTKHRYAVRIRPSPDPLPGRGEQPADDDEVPF